MEYSDLQHCVSFCYKANRISYTYIHSFSDSNPINVITVYWIGFPVLYRRFLLSLLYILLLLSRFSCVRLCVTLWIVILQDPLSMELSRQEYWSGLPCPPPGYLPKPRDQTWVSFIAGRFFTFEPLGKPLFYTWNKVKVTPRDPMDCSLPGSSPWNSPGKVLEWVAVPFSRSS